MTDDDLYEIVAAAASLPASDIEKLVAATGQGQQALRLLRSRTSGGLREACSTVLLMEGESSLAELCGILKGAAAAGRVGRGQVDLVWTGPDVPGSTSRLTSEVIADLVDQARSEVLLISEVHPEKWTVVTRPSRSRSVTVRSPWG